MVLARRKVILFLGSLLLPQLVGTVGALFTFPAIASWYVFLEKPFLSPPNWIFGPVWTALYLMMGVSFYLILTSKPTKFTSKAIQLFLIQMFFNLIWSIVFFGMQSTGGGLVVIIALWIAILLTILKFSKISRNASILLLPYLAWVTFASYLNLSLFLLNS